MLPLIDAALWAPPTRWLEALAAWLSYLGALYGAGAFFFLLMVPATAEAIARRTVRRAMIWAVVAFLAAAAFLPIRAAFLGGSWEMGRDPELLRMLAFSPLGQSLAVRGVGCALVLAGSALWLWGAEGSRRVGARVAAGGGVALLFGVTSIGHSASLAPATLWQALLLLHLLVAAFWLGSLYPLHQVSRHENRQAGAEILARFGRMAAVAVGVLIAMGAMLGFVLLGGTPAALLHTAYGGALTVKLALVALLLLLAAWHKWILVPRLAASAATGPRLAWSIGIERWVAAAVVAATALTTTLSGPPGL